MFLGRGLNPLPKNFALRSQPLDFAGGLFCQLSTVNVVDNRCITESYRYQWMDETQQTLRKRWDNVEHFPNLPNFPHHVHIGEESNVEPSCLMNILELIDLIEKDLHN
ncbi:DUF6516 family protein [Microcoleus sp. bin38.metabat.b11b12b14.051]|uniref:toxin-antitoxin system TumE family protein n=1 Tax=Microcoleus sp. bin38.metabat.b11b12b14.051 TaxID=2742709 RepID=UPI0025F64043|nr:DUF6516 family protein [Microcoleus sp. bin38.metabat.b11b12b14.051]